VIRPDVSINYSDGLTCAFQVFVLQMTFGWVSVWPPMGRILNIVLKHAAVCSPSGAAGVLIDLPMSLIAVFCGCNSNIL
jgi:hypothetical protein